MIKFKDYIDNQGRSIYEISKRTGVNAVQLARLYRKDAMICEDGSIFIKSQTFIEPSNQHTEAFLLGKVGERTSN
jgi:CRISPR/Cas system CSM-associated protein Csm4 (group 5 of RAMP superfamily)